MFAGAFLWAVTRHYRPEQAAWLANHAAARVVSQPGNRLGTETLQSLRSHFTQQFGEPPRQG
jgi:sugar/nucleoside kinase (ribokinase family)